MKTLLIYLTLFALSLPMALNAQKDSSSKKELVENLPLYNFFHLSKYLDQNNLSDGQTNAINAQFINLIGSDKIKYLQDAAVIEFPNLKKHLIKIENSPPGKEELISYLKNKQWSDLYDRFSTTDSEKKTLNRIIREIAKIDSLSHEKLVLNKKYEKFNNETKKFLSENTDSVKNDSVQKKSKLEDEIFKVANDKKSNEITLIRSTLDKKIETFANSYFKTRKGADLERSSTSDFKHFYIEKEVGQNIQLTSNYVQSIQSQGTSSFKLPSEAQLIDAMAIFLANRAKQEAAIWFMDQLRTRLKNPLVKDAFPETIKLISSLEDYKVPNFGTEWRYAVSSDFIMMPENIVKSDWMKLMVKEKELGNIKTAIEFGSKLNRLMAENYNYRDIIQTLYLDKLEKENTYKVGETFQQYIDNSVTMLYLMTNELYSIDHLSNTPTYRLLNFEELNSLNKNQWEYFVELVYLKYFYNKEVALSSDYKKIKSEKQKTNVYISKVLLSLSQFDKIRKDLEKSSADEKKDFSKQNYNSAWKLISQILKNLNETAFLGKTADTVHVKKLQTSIKIYENIQERNFRAAIQNTLSLINEFNDYGTYNKNAEDNKVYSFVINNQKLIIQKINENVLLNIVNPKEKKLEIQKTNRFFTTLTFDSKTQKRLKVFSVDHRDKEFLNKINTEGDYSKLLKKLNLTSDELIKYIDSIKQYVKRSDDDIKFAEYQAPLNEKYSAQLLKLASFFGDVLSATNSDQLADVISSHALPPTSYKLKRKVKSSIDFNAYVGAYGGYKLASSNSTYIDGWTGGITAPIGITYTRSFGNNGNGTFGVSFNFIDLGNIVNHYLTSTEKYYKDVHFSEVFSPNVNILYSIKNTPLVAFVGGSFLPMKNIFVDEKVRNNRAFDVSIIQVGLKIDIPLINLWSNQKE